MANGIVVKNADKYMCQPFKYRIFNDIQYSAARKGKNKIGKKETTWRQRQNVIKTSLGQDKGNISKFIKYTYRHLSPSLPPLSIVSLTPKQTSVYVKMYLLRLSVD